MTMIKGHTITPLTSDPTTNYVILYEVASNNKPCHKGVLKANSYQ